MSTTARLTRTKRQSISGADRERRWRAVMKRDGERCAACGTTRGELTLDHIIPLSKGGRNRIANTQILCRSCNDRKADRVE